MLEIGPHLVGQLPPDSIDFLMDMAAVAFRDYAERHIEERAGR